jgi:hypothetical protein|tara:strand:+ start:10648 stop:11658 length:1011 start_codon:yes stop_codon:yes gene_type:complete
MSQDIIYPIQPVYVTQKFGANPRNYSQYGIKGHNGIDYKTKFDDTPKGFRYIVASYLSRHYKTADEGSKGFGKYFEVIVQLKNTWKLRYAHCKSIQKFQTKDEGEPMAISDNTGNSTASHLHFDVKRVEYKNGKITKTYDYNNGFFGCVNPQIFFDELREYKRTHSPTPQTKITIDNTLYEMLVGESSKLGDVHAILEIKDDPKHTSIETYKKVIAGIKGDAKTVREDNIELKGDIEDLEQEMADESAKCQRTQTALEADIKALTEKTKMLLELEDQLETRRKEIKKLKISLAKCKSGEKAIVDIGRNIAEIIFKGLVGAVKRLTASIYDKSRGKN